MDVNRPVVAAHVPAENLRIDIRLGNALTEIPPEHFKKRELGRCQLDILFRRGDPHAALCRVDGERTDNERRDRGLLARGAAQNSADSRDQLTRRKGFRHIVICAEFKPDDPVRGIASGCQHNDRNMRVLADLGKHFSSFHAGHHDIENDEIKIFLRQLQQPILTVIGRGGRKTFQLKVIGEKGNEIGVVVNNKNLGSTGWHL